MNIRIIAPVFAAFMALPVTAQDNPTLQREVETALVRAAESGTLSTTGHTTTLRSQARVRYELGAVVDVRNANASGLPVLAVTPGSAASRLGLQAGDRLLAINGRKVGTQASQLQQAIDAGGGKLAASWSRAGKQLAANDTADAVAIPAFQLVVGDTNSKGCGFVSDQQGVVPKSEDTYRGEITRIDGRSTPLAGLYQYELPTGRHVLTIAEKIDRHRMSLRVQRTAHLANRLKTAAQSYKTLVIDVKPNTSYLIGVRLLEDKLDNDSIRRNAYWEPVIWETRAQACR
ncbi:PDZ domain-containing protein [Solilutibacter tolerans]|uniref:PDZ domain (Also known as DHR or GLGF) n=1 Tax=Solilutibacter tolerans TaxID=1604334 RepID=A0A1N6NKI8_9GAMM|nr:PDZ domain-containing protein [Lysobacter tolerans]SIP92584.1 PDZ domain (Also known as DHR or GLGF) [Lysobacter tolerans]